MGPLLPRPPTAGTRRRVRESPRRPSPSPRLPPLPSRTFPSPCPRMAPPVDHPLPPGMRPHQRAGNPRRRSCPWWRKMAVPRWWRKRRRKDPPRRIPRGRRHPPSRNRRRKEPAPSRAMSPPGPIWHRPGNGSRGSAGRSPGPAGRWTASSGGSREGGPRRRGALRDGPAERPVAIGDVLPCTGFPWRGDGWGGLLGRRRCLFPVCPRDPRVRSPRARPSLPRRAPSPVSCAGGR